MPAFYPPDGAVKVTRCVTGRHVRAYPGYELHFILSGTAVGGFLGRIAATSEREGGGRST